ncbi:MAG: diguanylate cyclase [Deltaproteobacteria bacterium]|nr:diguanylate cyclase [Deltaproteobacteria bacterium]
MSKNQKDLNTILIVEDSKSLARLLRDRISRELQLPVSVAYTYRDARKVLEDKEKTFFAAVLDLSLPDAPDGEIVDLVIPKKIPSIILTGTFNDALRERILAKNAVDYVVKSGINDIEYVVNLLKRLLKNINKTILVADDDMTVRRFIRSLLELHKYKVMEVADGAEALNYAKRVSDIDLVITDYEMPKMNGVDLSLQLRKIYDKEHMAILGISSAEQKTLSARFLKAGANDFLKKPFLSEELLCRVTQNIEFIELLCEVREASIRDYLTGLYNRRYFYETAQEMFMQVQQYNTAFALAMIDVDYFKKINDHHGHDAGDCALKHLAHILSSYIGDKGLLARFGGEEFCILITSVLQTDLNPYFTRLKKLVASSQCRIADTDLKITVSIGIAAKPGTSLDAMIRSADEMLYKAKEKGRDSVVLDI